MKNDTYNAFVKLADDLLDEHLERESRGESSLKVQNVFRWCHQHEHYVDSGNCFKKIKK